MASETSRAILDQLGETLPTAAQADTEQTRREVGIHRALFFELCAKYGSCARGGR